jgi:integrase
MSLSNGARKSFYGKTRDAVRQKLNAAIREKDKGVLPTPERQIVGAFLASWLEAKKVTLKSPRTWDRYDEIVRLHLAPAVGKTRLAHLTPQQLEHLYAQKLDQGLSATTVHHIHTVLHTALEAAVRQNLVPRNVADLVDTPPMRRKEMKVWTAEQAKAFLAAVAGDRLYALYELALATGMRQGELFGLRWADVDLEQGTLRICTTVRRSRLAGMQMAEPKTAGSLRQIAIDDSIAETLRAHRTRQLEERLALGPAWQDRDLIFPDLYGSPLRGNNFDVRSFFPAMRKAGVPRIRFHDLRHTSATLLIAAGEPVKVVSEMLGHADVATTQRFYVHVLPHMQRNAAKTMARLLGR